MPTGLDWTTFTTTNTGHAGIFPAQAPETLGMGYAPFLASDQEIAQQKGKEYQQDQLMRFNYLLFLMRCPAHQYLPGLRKPWPEAPPTINNILQEEGERIANQIQERATQPSPWTTGTFIGSDNRIEYHVSPGMNWQDTVSTAAYGSTIYFSPGTYNMRGVRIPEGIHLNGYCGFGERAQLHNCTFNNIGSISNFDCVLLPA